MATNFSFRPPSSGGEEKVLVSQIIDYLQRLHSQLDLVISRITSADEEQAKALSDLKKEVARLLEKESEGSV